MQMREIAQEAFVKANAHRVAQKALKARPRVQRDWKPGDLVYVYRVMRQRRTVSGGGGRVARRCGQVREGAILWVNMMGELRRVSAEQTRHATYEERMGAEVVAESFEEMRERLKRNPNRPGFTGGGH